MLWESLKSSVLWSPFRASRGRCHSARRPHASCSSERPPAPQGEASSGSLWSGFWANAPQSSRETKDRGIKCNTICKTICNTMWEYKIYYNIFIICLYTSRQADNARIVPVPPVYFQLQRAFWRLLSLAWKTAMTSNWITRPLHGL